jgi:hypothetical protein
MWVPRGLLQLYIYYQCLSEIIFVANFINAVWKVLNVDFLFLSIKLKDDFNLINKIYTDFVLKKRMTALRRFQNMQRAFQICPY